MANLSMYRVAMAKVRWRTDRAALRGGTYSFMINVYIYILKQSQKITRQPIQHIIHVIPYNQGRGALIKKRVTNIQEVMLQHSLSRQCFNIAYLVINTLLDYTIFILNQPKQQHMENITSVPGKLLYLAHKLWQTKLITFHDKALLKDMIISQHKDVEQVYKRYALDGTELTITTDLISLVRAEKQKQTEDLSSSQGSKRKRRMSVSVTIPKRDIQKLSHMQNRI